MNGILRVVVLLLISGGLLPPMAWGQPVWEQQDQAISRLGELNGIALNCGYPAETMRMKKALIANVPKRRGIGQLFDDKTHESFLNFIQQGTTCPDERELQGWIDEAIITVKQVYGAN